MKVLILGSGGREHALGWKISKSPLLGKLYFAPGNPGTMTLGTNVSLSNTEEVVAFAQKNAIDLVIPGPEAWLIKGIVDELTKVGVRTFGPRKQAAMLEGSKAFAKRLMVKADVPTAKFEAFSNADSALQYLENIEYPIVVKADALLPAKASSFAKQKMKLKRPFTK